MGKTWKKAPYRYYRKPRGKKSALINEVRKGAIPPDAYDDIRHNRESYCCEQAGRRMLRQGFKEEEIYRRLVKKFRISYAEAKHRMGWIVKAHHIAVDSRRRFPVWND